ncbi:ABC transporter permease [Erythrobacter dokdonensis]|uniref:Iron(III) ABC transporter permease protein n=1 Tax=Erythrobacter dokdonensis DSW-74 TaxID=1300349 RepID=A0A1A7BD79_9SPHN|nr:iron ABC transporter permease [Erythrobacter dokdonensis]OBV10449.1 Iron(III) ABC transporter permease protein [Erythrobacter dokdonensis DSW-74]
MSRLRQFAGPQASAPASTGAGWRLAALAIAALAGLPIAAILVAATSGGIEALAHLARTVLGEYVLNTGLLMLLAGSLAAVVGTSCAWLVAATDFPGRRLLGWALVLPLAVPAYIAAYIYADMLDFAGPVQSGLRALTGWGPGDYAFPEIRSLGGGALVLGLVLYPYVYLLARTAFATQSLTQFRAARSLGASPSRAFWRIVLPAARPAIAGGLALVLMEVLADFGVAEYFAIPTFSTGIFRSWLAMGDKAAALKLAAVMLAFVIALVALEAATRSGRSDSHDGLALREGETLVTLSSTGKALALCACLAPVLLGFVIPAGYLGMMALTDAAQGAAGDLASYALDSMWLGLAASGVCLVAALLLAFARARSASRVTAGAIRLGTLGYALPGALLAVGLLAPLGSLDQSLTRLARDNLGWGGGLLLTGTSAILVYALSVRFLTVAYNSVSGGLARIPPALDSAARSLGAGPARVLARIYAPLLAPSLAGAAALVFIDTLRELPATLILRPFNLETLATRTYRLASDERLVEASIPALILLAAGLLPVLLLNRLGKR